MICSYCSKDKIRLSTGDKNNQRRFIYLDGEGKRWIGRKCPQCCTQIRKGYSRAIQQEIKDEKAPLTTRKCVKCASFLAADRYFNCRSCVPVLDDDFGSEYSYDANMVGAYYG